ncbi:DUF2892 domain-containing protein [bacterium]|nr:DUF2892 domain-containing protein [bacterium]
MTRERIVRLVAGAMVLVSLALGVWVNSWWLLLTAFVGANLFQSALTKWCLLDDILRMFFGVKSEAERVRQDTEIKPPQTR